MCAGQDTRQGVVSRPATPAIWNKSSVDDRSRDSVCVRVCVPPSSCDPSPRQALRSAESIREAPCTEGAARRAGRGEDRPHGWMDGCLAELDEKRTGWFLLPEMGMICYRDSLAVFKRQTGEK